MSRWPIMKDFRMSITDVRTEPRWRFFGLWLIRGLLVLAFVAAGSAKLYGVPMLVEEFQHIGVGQWFRYVTGALEILGAALLLVPSKTVFGALLLCCIMVGAIITHLFVIGGSPLAALVLLMLSAVLAYAKRHQLGA